MSDHPNAKLLETLYTTPLSSSQFFDTVNLIFKTLPPLRQPSSSEFAQILSYLSLPSPHPRIAALKFLSAHAELNFEFPQSIFCEGLGALVIAKALIDANTIKEKEVEKLNKYKTLWRTMNKYAAIFMYQIFLLTHKIPSVWVRALIERYEICKEKTKITPKNVTVEYTNELEFAELIQNMLLEMSVCCPKEIGLTGTDILKGILKGLFTQTNQTGTATLGLPNSSAINNGVSGVLNSQQNVNTNQNHMFQSMGTSGINTSMNTSVNTMNVSYNAKIMNNDNANNTNNSSTSNLQNETNVDTLQSNQNNSQFETSENSINSGITGNGAFKPNPKFEENQNDSKQKHSRIESLKNEENETQPSQNESYNRRESIKQMILYEMQSLDHKQYLGIDDILISIISPMSSPEHWFNFEQFRNSPPQIKNDKMEKENEYLLAVKTFFEVIKTWQGLLTLTAQKGIDILILSLRSPIPSQINMILNQLYKLFGFTLSKNTSKETNFRMLIIEKNKNIFNQSELILSYYTHLLVTLIDSKFFDELCDVCIGRHLDDNFMVEENVNVTDNSAIPQTQAKTMRRQSFSIKDAINGPKRSTFIDHRITDDLDTEKEDGIVDSLSVSKKAIVLLGGLLQLAGMLLPKKHLLLEKLFSTACNFKSELQASSSSLLINLHSLIQENNESIYFQQTDETEMSIKDYMNEDEKIGNVKEILMSSEVEFKKSIQNIPFNDKNYANWKWVDIRKNLIILKENIKFFPLVEKQPFLKQLVKFYLPSEKKFSEIDESKGGIYIKCGLLLFQILFSSPNGHEILNTILKEMCSELKYFIQQSQKKGQEDFYANCNEKNHFFDMNHINSKCSKSYFNFIGKLSEIEDKEGLLNDIFELYISIISNKQLTTLSMAISQSFNLSLSENNFKVIEEMLKSDNSVLNNRALKEIGSFVKNYPDSPNFSFVLKARTIPLLVKNMKNKKLNKINIKEIVQIFASMLNDERTKNDLIDFIITANGENTFDFQIAIDHAGESILYELMKAEESMKQICQTTSFVRIEFEKWINYYYTKYIETIDVAKHPHLFQILSLTQSGRELLKRENTIEIMNDIMNDEKRSMLNRGGAMISLAYIASTPFGSELVSEEIVNYIISRTSDNILFLRGLSTWAISILSNNTKYNELLKSKGWIKSDKGIMIPESGLENEFYHLQIEKQMIPNVKFTSTGNAQFEGIDVVDEKEIEKAIRRMRHANMWRGAMKEITKKRAEKPELFTQNIRFNLYCCGILNSAKIGQIQRSFVYDTFLDSIGMDVIKKELLENMKNNDEVEKEEQ